MTAVIANNVANNVANDSGAISYYDLGLSPVALDLGIFELRWYSLGYLAGIFLAYWYLLKLIKQPGAPLARRHADDLVFYASLGVIFGGRLGYVLFYNLTHYLANPLDILKLWDGGMSFHGGVIGVTIGILYLARKEGLNWLRVHDYVACTVPIGLGLVRVANFINGELWGKATDVAWGVRFPLVMYQPALGPARHPTQLYEALLEGVVLFAILAFLFWKTRARYEPGKLVGAFILFYGLFRFAVEFIREPDDQFIGTFIETSGLHMGQWLSLPMIFGGVYLMVTAKGRRERIEPVAGTESVA